MHRWATSLCIKRSQRRGDGQGGLIGEALIVNLPLACLLLGAECPRSNERDAFPVSGNAGRPRQLIYSHTVGRWAWL